MKRFRTGLTWVSSRVIAVLAAACLAALAETVTAATQSHWSTDAGRVASASFLLLGLYLPLAVPATLLMSALTALVRHTPWLERARFALTHPLEPDAQFVEHALAWLLVVVGAAAGPLVADRLAIYLHNPILQSAALSIGSLAGLFAGALVAALVGLGLRPVLRRVEWLARPITWAAALLGLAIGVAAAASVIYAPTLAALGGPFLASLGWIPGAALGGSLLGDVFARGRRGLWRGLGALAVSLAVFYAAGRAYGEQNRVRTVVETRTVLGYRLVSLYARLADRDRDGHPSAFGGRDCDDSRDDVYPGARDVRGDGVDADCDGEDGAPPIELLGDVGYAPAPAASRRANVVLFTIDALRPDHLGCYGYGVPTSPRIDAFAATAVRFDRAIASSSRTLWSLPPLFTGLYTSQVRYGDENVFRRVEPENLMLAERLHAAGYRTEAYVASDYFNRIHGLFQGFDTTRIATVFHAPRPEMVDAAIPRIAELGAQGTPFFLWIHQYNVHGPYLHDGIASRFGPSGVAQYDTEVFLADEQFGRVLDALRAANLDDRTVVVLASDHGEQLGEHGFGGHSHSLYEEEIRAVMIVRAPGLAPRVVRTPVSLIDITPTITNLLDVPIAERLSGRSQVGRALGAQPDAPDHRNLVSELLPDGLVDLDLRMLRRDDRKLVWTTRTGAIELFDLRDDPHEVAEISDDHPDDARRMLAALQSATTDQEAADARPERVIAENRLAALPARIGHRLDLDVAGAFRIVGYDLPRTNYAPGETIELVFYVEVLREMDEDYVLQLNFREPPGFPVFTFFHGEHYPLRGAYHTNRWRPGELLRDAVSIPIPANVPHPVSLPIVLSVATWGGPRAVLGGGRDAVDLATIQIQ